mgnify:CR=1 FL=1
MTYSFLKQHSELVDDHLTIDVIVSCYKEKPAQRPEQGQILRPVHSVPYADISEKHFNCIPITYNMQSLFGKIIESFILCNAIGIVSV